MLSARILSAGKHYLPLADSDALPPLGPALREVYQQRFRRIDRFVQLALLGAGRCAAAQPPDPDCGVYLGAGPGPVSSNITVQETIIAQHESPMPFAFINTLGSSAVFNVASGLRLRGSAMFVSRQKASLQAALTCALLDLHAGATKQALVGVVEEAPLPLSDQRQRAGIDPEQPLAEGSHWWLLGADAVDAPQPRLQWHTQLDLTGLSEILPADAGHDFPLCLSSSLDASERSALLARFPSAQTTDAMAWHDSIDGAWLIDQKGPCALVSGSATAGWDLLHCLA